MGMENEQIVAQRCMRFRTSDLKKLRKKYRAGQNIEIERKELDYGGRNGGIRKTVRCETCVIRETYPHHVLVVNERGSRECFTYYELETIVKRPERSGGCCEQQNK